MTAVLLAVLLAAAEGAPAKKAAAPGGVKWESGFDAAVKKAKAAGKPVMIDFWAEWCGWCHTLDRTTYRDPDVVQLSRELVSVKVNAEGSTREVETAARYRVDSLPTILFLSSSGRLLYRLGGFEGPAEFPGTLRRVLALAKDVQQWDAALVRNPKDADALRRLGLHLFDQETFEESRELLAKAATVDADLPPGDRKRTRLALGIIQNYDRRFKESEELLKAALAIPPASDEDAMALYALGKTYTNWGKADEARDVLKKTIERFPDSDVSQRAREQLSRLDRQN